MFDQTFVDGTQKTNKTYTIVLSSILQATAICLLILTPLLYTQILPGARLKSILTAVAAVRAKAVASGDENKGYDNGVKNAADHGHGCPEAHTA